MTNENKKPNAYSKGALRISVFENLKDGKTSKSLKIQRSFKKKDATEWSREEISLPFDNQVGDLIALLQKVQADELIDVKLRD